MHQVRTGIEKIARALFGRYIRFTYTASAYATPHIYSQSAELTDILCKRCNLNDGKKKITYDVTSIFAVQVRVNLPFGQDVISSGQG